MAYRKIDARIWNDAKFCGLSDDGKLAFLLILTHPDLTVLGAMKVSPSSLADDLGWKANRFAKAFEEVSDVGLLDYDPGCRLLILPNFARYNPPQSPNVVKSWVKAFDLLPECALRSRLAGLRIASLEALPEGFREAIPEAMREAFRKAWPNQKQKQKQELREEPSQGEVTLSGKGVGADATLRALPGGRA